MSNLLKLLYASNHVSALLCILFSGMLIFSGCTPMVSESAMAEQSLTPLQTPEQNDRSGQTPVINPQQTPAFSAEQNQSRLQKVETLIQAGDNIAAQNLADTINPLDLPNEQQAWLNLLNAQIMLGLGDPDMAIKWLAAILSEQLDPPHKIAYYQSQAFAHSLTGHALDSAKSRIELNDLLASPEQRDENQAAILEALALLPDSELENSPASATDSLAGWMSLAKLLKLKGQPGFNERIMEWRENFPGHPANTSFLENTQETPAENNLSPPTSIAFFLPESGAFAQAGKAIRAGFMAAYNEPGNSVYKPSLRFYDSEQATALFLYNQAIADGAKLIIGPLQKEAIQSLANSVTLQVPVLALNHIPGLEKNNLYQFGLSPIDDVDAITRKAWLDGHRKAVVLIPDNAQGHRIANYFVNNWQELGGTIVDTQAYKLKETDFSEPIKKLLNLDESENRYNKIPEAAPGTESVPRRRRDVDVLLLNTNSFEARSINPQLHYYQSSPLPVYATPGVYSGQANPSLDSDLNQITFCDTPWLLDRTYLGALSMDDLKNAWQAFPGSYLRLFAMGIDAYHLTTRLKTLDLSPYAGATGELSIVADNRIKRDLACAKFVEGRPAITDPIKTSGESLDINVSDPEAPMDIQPNQEQPSSGHVAE